MLVRYLHLLAMARFVGGQLFLVVAVVPTLRAEPDRERLRAIARQFGWATRPQLHALEAAVFVGSLAIAWLGTQLDRHLQPAEDEHLTQALNAILLPPLLVMTWRIGRGPAVMGDLATGTAPNVGQLVALGTVVLSVLALGASPLIDAL